MHHFTFILVIFLNIKTAIFNCFKFGISIQFAVLLGLSKPISEKQMPGCFRGPLGKRKISYAKPVFCTNCCQLSVMNGISPVPA